MNENIVSIKSYFISQINEKKQVIDIINEYEELEKRISELVSSNNDKYNQL